MKQNYQKEFEDLAGHTIVGIDLDKSGCNDWLVFKLENGDECRMGHHQGCCEDVGLEWYPDEWTGIVGEQVICASVSTQDEPDNDWGIGKWTFYTICTTKNTVTLRWYGSSNGYYSVDVSFDWYEEGEEYED